MVVEEIPILEDIIADNQKLIDDMTNKLEAIKKLVEKGPNTSNWQDIDDLMGKLMNIIESSGFTTNSEEEK